MKIMFMTLRDRVERFTDFSNLSKDWEYVFAGYEKDMQGLYKSNSGRPLLRNRQ